MASNQKQLGELWNKLTAVRRRTLYQRMCEPVGSAEKAMTYAEAVTWCASRWRIKTSVSQVHTFYQTMAAHERSDRALKMAATIRMRMAQDDPRGAIAALVDDGLLGIIADAVAAGDAKELKAAVAAFVQREHLELSREKLEHEKQRFWLAKRTKLEAGMDALHREIRDNPAALEVYDRLMAIIRETSTHALSAEETATTTTTEAGARPDKKPRNQRPKQ